MNTDYRPATCRAHPNLALAKYWGKRDVAENIPAVPSLSAGLDDLFVEATVAFGDGLDRDELTIDGRPVGGLEAERVSRFVDLFRERYAPEAGPARVATRANFPRAAGLASSAAAFAALAWATSTALQLPLGAGPLSTLARRGSGSAARSVVGGYVELPSAGIDPEARVVAPAEHLPLGVAVAVVDGAEKAVSSRRGMELTAATSVYYDAWVSSSGADFADIRDALLARDFERLARASERSCVRMHASILGTDPPIAYWRPATLSLIHEVTALRRAGTPAFFTIDAGPNVTVFFEPEARAAVQRLLDQIVDEVRWTRVGGAPRVIEDPSS